MKLANERKLFEMILFFELFSLFVEAMENHITDVVHRQIRSLTYPEDSEMGLFFALAIPLDDPVSTKSISVAFFFEANYELPNNITDFYPDLEGGDRRKRSIDRRTSYAILESKFESIGFPGQECLLRSICETVKNPIHLNNGILGNLMHIILTPSTSADEYLPVEYTMAEERGRGDDCAKAYPLCPIGIYDYITTAYD